MKVFGIGTEWKTALEITSDPRGLKRKVRAFNDLFGTDESHQVYIVSGSLGYRLTADKEEIMQSIDREYALANTRYGQASRRRKLAEDFFSNNERLPL